MPRLLLGLVALLLMTCNAPRSTYQASIEQARALVLQTMEANHFPGLAVAVAHRGRIIWSEGFGYADVATGLAVDPAQHLFRVGSVSKPITAVGLAKLYEEGKIDLDTTIQTYVPYFPPKRYDISLRQLGGHLAGIRHYRNNEFMINEPYASVRDGIAIFEKDSLLSPPNTKYAYTSYGFNLISAAMEGASGQPFLEYMQQEVFDPLKLSNIRPDHVDSTHYQRTTYYTYDSGRKEWKMASPINNSYKWAGGGFIGTAEEVARFGVALSKPGFLRKSTIDLFTASQFTTAGERNNYGIGWASDRDGQERRWYGHSGGSVGGTSMLAIFPDDELVVVTLVNMSAAQMDRLAFRLANVFLTSNKAAVTP